MPEYESTAAIGAPPQAVFDFASNPDNLPKYTPTLKEARVPEEGRIHATSRIRGQEHAANGYFRVDPGARRMEWGSDGNRDYCGWLQVRAADGGCEVTIHIHLNPPPDETAEMERMTEGDMDSHMEESLERALVSIRNHMEGHGGKEELPESA